MEDFGLIRFLPLAIEDRETVARVLADVDRANGCAFSGLAGAAAPLPPELTYGAGLKGALDPDHEISDNRFLSCVVPTVCCCQGASL